MSANPPRLFLPDDGALPPALVGRSAEQAVLGRCLDDLARGAAPPHNVVLVGPRGNGKTALLNWFKTTCGGRASGVDVLRLTPGEVADTQGLIDTVAPRRGVASAPTRLNWCVSGSRKFPGKARSRADVPGRTSSGRNAAGGLPAATRRARPQASARFVAVFRSMARYTFKTRASRSDACERADASIQPGWSTRLLPRKVGVASAGSAEWQPARERNFKRALLARCRRRPLALLLDEAHTLDLGVGGLLLNASQQVRAEAPFLLVLAGTPGLAARLGAMDASFWSRLGAGLLGIGRLDAGAARAALVEPLRANDVRIEAGALETVVEDSQCYPYFIQLWGDALWQDHLATGASELTAETVAAARPKVAAWVADYYQSRYRELRGGGLMSAAVAVVPLFLRQNAAAAGLAQNATASERELDAALAATGVEDAADRFATLESLNRLGYVWCPPGQGAPMAWSAGIPSLMRYVLDQAGAGPAGGG